MNYKQKRQRMGVSQTKIASLLGCSKMMIAKIEQDEAKGFSRTGERGRPAVVKPQYHYFVDEYYEAWIEGKLASLEEEHADLLKEYDAFKEAMK